MKLLICCISMFCLSYINAQKPPLKATVNCSAVVGIYEEDLTDKEGISLKYSSDLCDRYYKDKPYTGKVKTCKNNKIFGITNYVNGRLQGEEYFYSENGNLSLYRVYGKDTTRGEGALLTDEEASEKNGKPTFREVLCCDGVLNGEDLSYHENGKLEWKRLILNGIREGQWYFYDEKGALTEIKSFKDDKEDGKWIFYDEKGAIMTIRTYKEGKEISCSGKCY